VQEFSTIRRIGDVMASLSPRRDAARDHSPASVGVFVQWGIGDAVLTTPLLAGLRAAWPEVRIDAIGKPWLADLFAGERFVDRCVALAPPWTRIKGKYRVWDREWPVFAREIAAARRTRYDLLIGIRWDIRELLLSRALRAAGMAGFAEIGGRKWVTIDISASMQRAMARCIAARSRPMPRECSPVGPYRRFPCCRFRRASVMISSSGSAARAMPADRSSRSIPEPAAPSDAGRSNASMRCCGRRASASAASC
jgi:hypothetical protein